MAEFDLDLNLEFKGLGLDLSSRVSDDDKSLFASMETSGDITGDYLQLEKSTFDDLVKRKKIRSDITWEQVQSDQDIYDETARGYMDDLQETFGIPTTEEAALWSWRPGWYKKYDGKIENIPEDKTGVAGKTGRQVMEDRFFNLTGEKYSPRLPGVDEGQKKIVPSFPEGFEDNSVPSSNIPEIRATPEDYKAWQHQTIRQRLSTGLPDDIAGARAVVDMTMAKDEQEPSRMQKILREAEDIQWITEAGLEVGIFRTYAIWDRVKSLSIAKATGQDPLRAAVRGDLRITDVPIAQRPEVIRAIKESLKVGAEQLKFVNPLFAGATPAIKTAIDKMSDTAILNMTEVGIDVAGLIGTGAVLRKGAQILRGKEVGRPGVKPEAEVDAAYDTLGVKKGSTPAEIKSAYRKSALRVHPDKGGSVEQFNSVQESYNTIRDSVGEEFFAGLPVPREIVERFNLTPQMLENIAKGQFKDIPAAVIDAIQVFQAEQPLIEEVKKYKSIDEFEKDYEVLYHGGSENIIGGKLSLGGRIVGEVTPETLGKGQDYGGIFFTPEIELAQTFAGHAPGGMGAVHKFIVKKDKLFDRNIVKHRVALQNFVGKEYTNVDGEKETFTERHYDFMFPKSDDGKRYIDWATMDPQVLEELGFEGAKVVEHFSAYGKGEHLYTTVLFKGGEESPHWKIQEGQQLIDIWNKAQEKVTPTFEVDLKEDIKVSPQLKNTALDRRIDEMADREAQVAEAQRALEDGGLVGRWFSENKIRKYKDEQLKEELEKLPSKYVTTRPTAPTPDEAIANANEANLGITFKNESELVEFLDNWVKQEKKLKGIISEQKPKFKRKKETTLLKEKVVSKERYQRQVDSIVRNTRQESVVAGRKEIRSNEALKRKTNKLVNSLQSMGDRKIPVDYKEQVDAMLEQYDLKGRAEVTKARRISVTEFVDDMRETGDLAFIPKEFFRDYGVKRTLDEMTLDDLELLHNQVKVLVTAGSNEGKLIAGEKEKNFEETVDKMVKTIYKRGKMAEPTEEDLLYKPPSARKKSLLRKQKDSISEYFAEHRQIENLTTVLGIWNDIWKPMQDATNIKLRKGNLLQKKFKNIFDPIAKQSPKMLKETITVPGVHPITRWEAVGVALNSENLGNVERLMQGQGYTEEQIRVIREQLIPTEKEFVNDVFDLIDSYWADTEATTVKAVGIRPKKIVEGKYFPIHTDFSEDVDAQAREAQKDLMRDVFSKAFLEKGFVKSRRGGRGAVKLDVLPVILKHLDDVIHYNAFVLPLRDVQKIINHPRFKKAIIDVMGEATYDQFKPWLADTVNPRSLSPKNRAEFLASILRKNSTASILAYKISVSLLQAGSFSQTVAKIGLKSALGGVVDYWKNPIEATKFIYARSPEQKNRAILWDRELRDWLESKHAQNILKGLPGEAKSTLFVMIRSVDFVTVMPSWMGSYNKELARTGDKKKAEDFADHIVRITQPMGSPKDLPRVLRGRPFQKFFTMFKSFYIRMHNMLVDIKDEYRFSEDPFFSKTSKAALGYWWTMIFPALLATWIRSGFTEKDSKEYAKGIITFPITSLFLIGDAVNAISKGFEMKTPALKAFDEFAKVAKSKTVFGKVKGTVKGIGTFSGLPVDAVWTFGEGMADLMAGRTTDPRRLAYSKYALGEKKKPSGVGLDLDLDLDLNLGLDLDLDLNI